MFKLFEKRGIGNEGADRVGVARGWGGAGAGQVKRGLWLQTHKGDSSQQVICVSFLFFFLFWLVYNQSCFAVEKQVDNNGRV